MEWVPFDIPGLPRTAAEVLSESPPSPLGMPCPLHHEPTGLRLLLLDGGDRYLENTCQWCDDSATRNKLFL